ncbi:MAG: phosphoserine transaminase [Actinomycetota bacterium]
MNPHDIRIPNDLKPSDGRFGAGPSKVRPEAMEALAERASAYMGTSHRQTPVRAMVARLQEGLTQLFSLPEDYEVLLGNGGTTLVWDAMAFGLVNRKSQHYVFGEFSAKCARAMSRAPHISEAEIISSEPGTHPTPVVSEGADLYALIHNETSTGVMMPVQRVSPRGLVAVDATSAAAGLRVDPREFDFYYFAPQKSLASEGGLWLSLASPAAIERIETIAATERYIPASLDLKIALDNSRKNQTYNTPGLATVFLAVQQVEWINDNGGLEWAASRCDKSSEALYAWAEACPVARPFVERVEQRSRVVATIDFDDSIDANALTSALRKNGIVDTEPYRKLGRNQMRVAVYPAVDPDDALALTACLDYVLERLP